LIDELADVLPRKHLAKKVLLSGLTVEQMMDEYQKLATRVVPKTLARSVSRDIDERQDRRSGVDRVRLQ
jgi:hypothetical protein